MRHKAMQHKAMRPKTIKFVAQEQIAGCVPACIAMITGRSYWDVAKDWGNDFSRDGVDIDKAIGYLADHGYTIVRKTVMGYNHKDDHRKELLTPFAPVHMVRFIPRFDSDGGHMVVMTEKGELICPDSTSLEDLAGAYAVTDIVGVYRTKCRN